MIIPFDKFHGAGNDFVIIDNRKGILPKDNQKIIENICNRRFGIGADGLMLLNNDSSCDFGMQYFNSDGREGSLCGNGSRCIVAFASFRKVISKKEVVFSAIDGYHNAKIIDKNKAGLYSVKVQLHDVSSIKEESDHCFLNTGSPHYVDFRRSLDDVNVYLEGRLIRYAKQFAPDGTNVDFVQVKGDNLIVRTYERGVEEETWACGTGVAASVIAAVHTDQINNNGFCLVETKGGILSVSYEKKENLFTNIWLGGPAQFVYAGKIEI